MVLRAYDAAMTYVVAVALALLGCSGDYACGWQRIEYDNEIDAGKLEPGPGQCSMVVANGNNTILSSQFDGCSAEAAGVSCAVLFPGDAVEIWHSGEWEGEANAGLAELNADGTCPLVCPTE